MSYSVKELYYTLQGEGAWTGRAAVFCRFAGCNLWTGREADRGQAICQFCDTDFVGTDGPGGGQFASANDLSAAIAACWREGNPTAVGQPLVVLTGGEPLLQLDAPLIDALHAWGCQIAVETNGTRAVPPEVDWVCVSPKAGASLVQTTGNELKLIFPQPGLQPEEVIDLKFDQFFLQPMDGPDYAAHLQATVAYCLAHPKWRLSLQVHKVVGLR